MINDIKVNWSLMIAIHKNWALVQKRIRSVKKWGGWKFPLVSNLAEKIDKIEVRQHYSPSQPQSQIQTRRDPSTIICFNCHKPGHWPGGVQPPVVTNHSGKEMWKPSAKQLKVTRLRVFLVWFQFKVLFLCPVNGLRILCSQFLILCYSAVLNQSKIILKIHYYYSPIILKKQQLIICYYTSTSLRIKTGWHTRDRVIIIITWI